LGESHIPRQHTDRQQWQCHTEKSTHNALPFFDVNLEVKPVYTVCSAWRS